ncbi:MAG: hypothetical protein ACK5MG_10440 [Bacteroidales bacterium]
MIFSLLPEEPPYRLSMDRTNWKFGKTDIKPIKIKTHGRRAYSFFRYGLIDSSRLEQ